MIAFGVHTIEDCPLELNLLHLGDIITRAILPWLVYVIKFHCSDFSPFIIIKKENEMFQFGPSF